jgi:hypothetical protein
VIQDLALRWVVTLVFGLGAAAFVLVAASGQRRWYGGHIGCDAVIRGAQAAPSVG